MAQDFTDSRPAWSARVDEDVVIIEKNFAALKSSFSGSTAPASPVAGMWWTDTSTGILKIRNAGNTAWLSVWDLVNNKPVLSGLSGDITATMISSALKSPAANVEGLRKLGTGPTDACAGNDERLTGYFAYTAGDYLICTNDVEQQTNSSTYVKLKETIVTLSGTLRISFSGRATVELGHSWFKIYRNGSPVGTERYTYSLAWTNWVEDIAGWNQRDAVQVYGRIITGGPHYAAAAYLRLYSGTPHMEYGVM